MSVVEDDRFSQRVETMRLVQRHLDGVKLAEPGKRSSISGGCLHVSIEHGMAILVLVSESLCGSALALVRPQFEACLRGIWLAYGTSDIEVDKAAEDEFPKISNIIERLETPGQLDSSFLSIIKRDSWKPLNSFTHTGYQQIGPRLNTDGIGPYFDDDQIQKALDWAESWTIMSAVAFAELAQNHELAHIFLKRARDIAAS